ncbi:hypothetical protein SESBI_18930 [Sesbania bispinosa]|nr:hypothetical protein SESBI_18930 [Sesbania bispinosa]
MQTLHVLRDEKKGSEFRRTVCVKASRPKKEKCNGDRDHRPASDEGGAGTKRRFVLGRFENCISQEKAEISTCKSP